MTDVLVVGGGPAGAATALLLARRGVTVQIIEKARFPRDKPCAEYMSPGVGQTLERLGVLDAVRLIGGRPLLGFRLYADGKSVQADFRGDVEGFAAPRRSLDEALIRSAAAAGARLCEGVRAIDVEEMGTTTSVHALHQKGRRTHLDAPIVVAADGVNSLVGHRFGVRRPSAALERIGLVTHMEGISDLSEYGEMHIGPGFYCGIAPFDRDTANAAMVIERLEAPGLPSDPSGYFLRRLRHLPSLAGRLDRARLLKPVTAIGPLAVHAVPPWCPGVLFVGDAAGFFDPFTGQGVYRALRSAELAAEAVAEALATGDRAGPLARYAALRRQEFLGSWTVERLVQAIVRRPVLLGHALQRLGRRKDMADILISVTGDTAPASSVLNPWYLSRLLV